MLVALSFPVIGFTDEHHQLQTTTAGQDQPNALRAGEELLSCPLQEGETTFVVSLPKGSQRDRFTFVNKNTAARGELRISVSNYKLPPSDPKWTVVDGAISFDHKRLFNLSMVGVEANYVKLSFHVEKSNRIAASGP